MLESKNTQFILSAEGEILWQEKVNNPLPGKPVAVLSKGEAALKPVISVLDNELTAGYRSDADKAQALLNHLKIWLNWHLNEIIPALVNLELPQGVVPKEDPVSLISQKVYEGMGIMPREELEGIISSLTPETRPELRAKKIRLGPVLVFIPELNKPAAVRLRALLWSLYNDHLLPAKVPSDGIVSVDIEELGANPLYYRSIGYPLYGGRAVRIDMLDRVISCVYDHANEGKFQARHEMAEWLGCSIEGLYKVLEAMGHKKTYDPAENLEEKPVKEVVPKPEEVDVKEALKPQEKPVEEVVSKPEEVDVKETLKPQEKPVEEVVPKPEEVDVKEEPKPQEKPELATFRLKKGKAFETQKRGGGDKGFKTGKKSFNNNKKKSDFKKGKGKTFSKSKDRGPRIVTAEAKICEEDNPFAILQKLKK